MNRDNTLPLRPYQQDALNAVYDAWHRLDEDDGPQRNVAVVLPTGSGKTVVMSHIADLELIHNPESQVLILVHRDELITQTVNKLHQVIQGVPSDLVGVVAGTRNDTFHPIVVGSVQTLARPDRLNQLDTYPQVIIVDECHHATAVSYRTILDEFPRARKVGFTATLARGDGRGLGDVWPVIAYRRDILDMVIDGYLVDPVGQRVTVEGLDLNQVARYQGELRPGPLGDAMAAKNAAEVLAGAYLRYAPDRPGIAFAPTVALAMEYADQLTAVGISAAAVYGTMPTDQRRTTLQRAHSGDLQVLTSCTLLDEGFDWPRAEVAAIGRPVRSVPRYVQMVGRVLRPYPGKTGALVLDLVGATDHPLASMVDLSTRRVREIRPNEGLLDAVKRERADNPALADYAYSVMHVDLFKASRRRWLQTHAGVWFLPDRRQIVFLWPDGPDRYRVGRRAYDRTPGRRGEWLHSGLSLETAMAWAEAAVGDAGLSDLKYRRHEPVTDRQRAWAGDLDLTAVDLDRLTKWEMSRRIEVHVASQILDPALERITSS